MTEAVIELLNEVKAELRKKRATVLVNKIQLRKQLENLKNATRTSHNWPVIEEYGGAVVESIRDNDCAELDKAWLNERLDMVRIEIDRKASGNTKAQASDKVFDIIKEIEKAAGVENINSDFGSREWVDKTCKPIGDYTWKPDGGADECW